MPDSRPTLTEIIDVVREFLSKDLSPLLPAHQQFQLRIADRLLQIVDRETRLKPAFDHGEAERLSRLLSMPGDLSTLNAELSARIRDGRIAIDDPDLLVHLRRSTEDALAINSPKWARP